MSVVVVTMPGGIMAVVREGRMKGGKAWAKKARERGRGPSDPNG